MFKHCRHELSKFKIKQKRLHTKKNMKDVIINRLSKKPLKHVGGNILDKSIFNLTD